MKKRMICLMGKHILLIAGGALIGLVALFLVHCLPTQTMKEHVMQSLPMLEREFSSQELVPGYPGTLTGNFTDCLMMHYVVYENEEHSILEQIFHMYRTESMEGEGWAPGYSLKDYLEGVPQSKELSYARYWHGYLVILKPIFALTNYNSIRILASLIQFVLVGLILLACQKRGESFLGIAFLSAVPFLYYVSLYASLSLSICFYLMALLVLVQLHKHEYFIEKKQYAMFFLVAGMLTSYFDFLTYPLVTLGFPLCICLYLNREGFKKSVKKLVGYSVEWGLGYVGLWTMKWILSDLLVGSNTIKDALTVVFERTDSVQNVSRIQGFLQVVVQNIGVYTNWPFVLFAGGILLWLLWHVWCVRKQLLGRCNLSESIVFLPVALFPFAWFFLVQNHSQEHWMYTCKILSVSVFAVLCAVGRFLNEQAK